MKRKDIAQGLNKIANQELSTRTAIHEAGHAAAIYLGNKKKQLPPVFFQIIIKEANNRTQSLSWPINCDNGIARVDGGRLIHTLPSSTAEATHHFYPAQKQAYERAFEADIINLLVGPLAEAMYVAKRDDELINPHLVNLAALHYYGGSSDLALINEYLECLRANREQREKKIAELFLAAYKFVSSRAHWRAITGLANYILSSRKSIIECEEAMAVLDNYL
jgi:hypothetical protein